MCCIRSYFCSYKRHVINDFFMCARIRLQSVCCVVLWFARKRIGATDLTRVSFARKSPRAYRHYILRKRPKAADKHTPNTKRNTHTHKIKQFCQCALQSASCDTVKISKIRLPYFGCYRRISIDISYGYYCFIVFSACKYYHNNSFSH